MSRARVPCRGSRLRFFFSNFFFLEKVIIDAIINVIKTNKKNLKKQMAREHLLVVGWGNREKLRDIHKENVMLLLLLLINLKNCLQFSVT